MAAHQEQYCEGTVQGPIKAQQPSRMGADVVGGGTWLPISSAPAQLPADRTVVQDDGISHTFPTAVQALAVVSVVVLLSLAAG